MRETSERLRRVYRAAARRGREKERAGGRERPAMRGAPPAAGEGCACNEPRRAAAQSEPSAAEAPAPRRSPPCINKYRILSITCMKNGFLS